MKKNNQVLLDNLRSIPDFPKKGINFRDVTTLYKSAECMKIMTDELYELYKDKGITKIVGIESRGFIMAAALAVPPVASRSSWIRTTSFSSIESMCISTVSTPYSFENDSLMVV